nr:MAG TPA: hypothetical protein [Caudoviricetes sp.]
MLINFRLLQQKFDVIYLPQKQYINRNVTY